MRVADFDYELPPELIAQLPLPGRSESRMLVVDPVCDTLDDSHFAELPGYLHSGDLLVFNDTRVMPARLRGHKEGSGGRVEVLVEEIDADQRGALCHVRASKAPREGTRLVLADGALTVEVRGCEGDRFRLDFGAGEPLADRLERYGEVPLPPYIARAPSAGDRERYQTVYARERGAVAAPTAGLHFDDAMLARLADRGVERGYVTLHVGAGTFQPVRVDAVDEHEMHGERICLPAAVADAIAATRERGGRVIAVGTTVVRTLEACADGAGGVAPWAGETRLFLRPGDRFGVVDGLLTNFHLPRSTLLMLVCAFAGQERVLRAYRHAVAERYRFFSYGDAMLVWADPAVRR